nr:Zinc finger domain containing protein [Haemonchus contortus]
MCLHNPPQAPLTESTPDVHLYTDHISVRDGKDLKCPKLNCDKVYPNKESLQHHIVAHYQRCADATLSTEHREDDSASSVTSVLASRFAEDTSDQRGSPLSDESDFSWPSIDLSQLESASDLQRTREDEQLSALARSHLFENALLSGELNIAPFAVTTFPIEESFS